MQRSLGVLALVSLLFASLSQDVATAEPITYTESGVGSGSLGGLGFNDAPFTITFTGDTSQVTSVPAPPGPPGPIFVNPVGTATVSIGGVGSAIFTQQLAAFDFPSVQIAGIADVTSQSPVLSTNDSEFGTYGLVTSIGPITNASVFSSGAGFNTDQGTFVLNSVGNSTFTAVAVPEPASVALLGLAISAMIGCPRRRRRI